MLHLRNRYSILHRNHPFLKQQKKVKSLKLEKDYCFFVLQELPSVEELTIVLPEDIELKPLGMVSSIIEQLGMYVFLLIIIIYIRLYTNNQRLMVREFSPKYVIILHFIAVRFEQINSVFTYTK